MLVSPRRVHCYVMDPLLCRVLEEGMAGTRYEFSFSLTRADLEKTLLEDPPHAVMFESRIDGSTNLDWVRRLRRRGTTAELPLLAIVGREHRSLRRGMARAVHAGVTDFVHRPFDFPLLHRKLELLMALNEERGRRAAFLRELRKGCIPALREAREIAELLRRQRDGETEPTVERLTMVLEALLGHATTLLRQDLAREAGEEAGLEEVDLEALVREHAPRGANPLLEGGVRRHLEIAHNLPRVLGDGELFARVFRQVLAAMEHEARTMDIRLVYDPAANEVRLVLRRQPPRPLGPVMYLLDEENAGSTVGEPAEDLEAWTLLRSLRQLQAEFGCSHGLMLGETSATFMIQIPAGGPGGNGAHGNGASGLTSPSEPPLMPMDGD